MPSRFQRAIRDSLEAVADPKVKASYEGYFKGALTFLGVRSPGVREIFRERFPIIVTEPVDRLLTEAFGLLRSRFAEEKQVAILVLAKIARQLPDDFLARLEPVYDEAVGDWATCDGLCGRVLRPLLERSARERSRIVGWSRSRHQWRQRAAAVAFVNEARHGKHTREILTVCDRIVRNPERFVQLGAGWVLRELFLADRDESLGFIRSHYAFMSREGLRYAVEKMPTALQRTLLAEHIEARKRLAAPRSRGA
jgi:3-methyladenine DNA glycosylase AlkD